MKFIYFTSKKYPGLTADHNFIKAMATAFGNVLKNDFVFVISGIIPDDLKNINTISIKSRNHFRFIFYLFYMPFFIIKNKFNNNNSIFFSNDPYLLSILIFWRVFLNLKYKICSDWHQIFGDWRDAYIAKNSDFLITTSKKLKKIITKLLKIDSNKILVSYGGVDLNLFKNINKSKKELRSILNLPEEYFLVGYVGLYKTMGMSKGLDVMINSLVFINDVNIKMVFVGGKVEEIEEYKKIAQKFNLLDRIIFIKRVDIFRVPFYEKAMDVLVIPYPNQPHFRDFGFPMKVYEYMASQRPIIYSKLELINEILSDCGRGFIPDDAKDLARSILFIKNSSKDIKEKVNLAYNRVERFSWERRADNIINFIKK
ncbi:MAG: glycosyltransferase [Minisyncoccota bacterium]